MNILHHGGGEMAAGKGGETTSRESGELKAKIGGDPT